MDSFLQSLNQINLSDNIYIYNRSEVRALIEFETGLLEPAFWTKPATQLGSCRGVKYGPGFTS